MGDMVEKKIMLAVILLIAVLLIGCGIQRQTMAKLGQEKEQETEKAEPETEEVEEETEEVSEEPEIVEAEPEEEEPGVVAGELEVVEEEPAHDFDALSREEQRKIKLILELLDEAREREENYFFRYSGPGILQTDVWVKGNILKRAIRRANELDKYDTYNMVYLNKATLKAEGYCETTKSKCWEGHGPFKETFSKWNIKTPKDWLLELGDDFTWALDNRIADQLYHVIDYHKDGETIRVYVNDYKGWPGRVEVYNKEKVNSIGDIPAEKHIYDDMDIGGVSDDDVIKLL